MYDGIILEDYPQIFDGKFKRILHFLIKGKVKQERMHVSS